ncbi:MAG: flagellar motor protein MotB [Gemmatimonadetes bacterium]|nr:flagellar motor protein MotB [Gemmatimonadota bacterium]
MAGPEKKKEEGGAPKWVVTFADMMSLLLAFFVLLLSFSSIQEAKFRELAGSMKGAFGVLESSTAVSINKAPPRSSIATIQIQQQLVQRQIEELVGQSDSLGSAVQVDGQEGGELRIKLSEELLFPSGSGDIRPEASPVLKTLASLLATAAGEVDIEGHTDNRPIRTLRYPSNWELSSDRAMAVLRSLERLGISPARMSATSFGEFRPVAPNDTPENRARNRRVELRVLMDEKIGTPEFLNSVTTSNSS